MSQPWLRRDPGQLALEKTGVPGGVGARRGLDLKFDIVRLFRAVCLEM
jgi:hypothetical protein